MMLDTASARALKHAIREWGRELGFQALGIAHLDQSLAGARLREWLAAGRHGEMDYMARHGSKRWVAGELVPGTLSAISARMDYWPGDTHDPLDLLARPDVGLARSKGDARRNLTGYSVNQVRLSERDGAVVSDADLLHGRFVLLSRGRRSHHLIVLAG